MARLIVLSYSPWSEKARWALDHHRIPYELEEYVPMLGEPMLRLRLRRLFGRVSVPALIDRQHAITDSFAIAQHAERRGIRAPLFPTGQLDTITRWNERSEAAIAAGRVIGMEKSTHSKEAREAALPKRIPPSLRPSLSVIADVGIRFLRAKYGVDTDIPKAEKTMAGVLEELRSALGGRPYLLDDFSYADIAMAVVLQFVRPVSDDFIRIHPATREVLRDRALEERFTDLCNWRDTIYAKHRK